ncbi:MULTISPECIES: DnaJ C-terminal domain-containing protein [unclassified Tolypothrix]|uniref:DnaJ C-terminal domain-containing protein n=1 Tax=unclassified Tolypothrix TaxID=2649714 RepID=UPI0005EAC245|nr:MULTISPECIES: DnaJ C-terminal domain-containing protein [unclassified Tolypothrix]BAY94553.1 heat shock protein DnaJ domain-containing protein [Microchaete diplosiphon NIES-3275]EKE99246.1 heat shock protein DnaJ [Tolypothrix sp. PCC 7601]MBE9084669.1 DnaJ domain-containing protein [Tolypothrix sp. LEGE 11397]UYD28254.1 DnaJ domain-containing protein [Tolypothrix sp. PCC 7712]UYD35870.1 DnaJ domain-containing protein [Tolypothrix sp. PCC 7601]
MAATDFKDYYAILGVSKTASPEEIKQAFRKLARKFHPDVNPGNKQAEASFKEVNEAYEVLSDPDKRKKYDQFGQYWKQAGQGFPSGAGVDMGGFDFSQYGSFNDFLNELFGGAGPRSNRQNYSYSTSTSSRRPGGFGGFNDFGFQDMGAGTSQDSEATITLTFAEAFAGIQKRFSLGNETIDVRIPAGAKAGTRLRVRGKGQINPMTQQRGDLYLKVELQPHSFFQFEGDNLICEVPITPDEATLGASIDVPTPDGSVNVKLPAGVRSGQSLRLRGKGWPLAKGGRGDQLVKVAIVPPKDMSQQEREYYEKIRAIRTYNPRSHLQQVKL